MTRKVSKTSLVTTLEGRPHISLGSFKSCRISGHAHELCIWRFFKENFAKTLAFVEQLKSIAARHNATTGQICLAWLLAQGEDIIPIPGTRRIKVCCDYQVVRCERS